VHAKKKHDVMKHSLKWDI